MDLEEVKILQCPYCHNPLKVVANGEILGADPKYTTKAWVDVQVYPLSREELVLVTLYQFGELSTEELSFRTRIGKEELFSILLKLQEEGLVERR